MDLAAPGPSDTPGNAIERVVGTIEMLSTADGPMRLSDIATGLGIPKSAVHRILTSLAGRGWVEQSQSDTYGLTLRMPLLGQHVIARLGLTDLRQPILERLADRTRELVRMTELRGEALVWVGSARGRRSGLVYEANMTERIVPFATANGKAWLATLPDAEALRIALAAGLGKSPDLPRAAATAAELKRELDATRERGYGVTWQEAEDGVAAIAVTVEAEKAIVGTMSVAGPIGRMGPDRVAETLPELRKAARSMALVWHTTSRALAP